MISKPESEALDRVPADAAAETASANALWLPAMLLAGREPDRCRRLLEMVLSRQREDGLLVDAAAGGSGTMVAAWPLWSCVADRVRRNFPDAIWVNDCRPAFQRAFLAAIRYFDPDHNGLPCWRSAAEAWDRRRFRENLATPELSVLLLLEADALQRLWPDSDSQLNEEREQLAIGLLEFMANPEAGRFDARRVGGGREPAPPRLSMFPLLWPGLSGEWIGRLLVRAEEALIPSLTNSRSPVPATELWLWRVNLARLGAHGLLARVDRCYRRKQIAGLEVDARETPYRLPEVIPLRSDIGGKGTILRLLRRFLPRLEARAAFAGCCLLLAVVWGLIQREPRLDAGTLALWEQEARTATMLGHEPAAREFEAAMAGAGVFPAYREMVAAQLAEQRGDWAEAAARYRRLRQLEGDTPPVLYGFARAMTRMNQRQEARESWQRFIETYGEAFPAAANAAREEWWRMEGELPRHADP